MMLTLNILEHELRPFGDVVRTCEDNPAFVDFRLFIEALPPSNPDILFLCSTRDDVAKATAEGCQVAYINPEDASPDDRAFISVLQGESILVVFNALLDLSYRFSEWERSMDSLRFDGGSLQQLLDISSDILRNDVVIVDSSSKLLASTKDVSCNDPFITEFLAASLFAKKDGVKDDAKPAAPKRFKPWADDNGFIITGAHDACTCATIVKSFRALSSSAIIMVMMCSKVNLDDYLLDVYAMFANRVEFYATRKTPNGMPAANACEAFLKDLLLGAVSDEQTLRERARTAGIPFDARFCLFCIREAENAVFDPRFLSDVSRVVSPAKAVLVDDAIAVLCFECNNDENAASCTSKVCPLGRDSLSSRIGDILEHRGLMCGRSSAFETLRDASVAFDQAMIACQVGCRKAAGAGNLDLSKDPSLITSFDSCVVDYLVESASRSGSSLVRLTYAERVLDLIYRQDLAAKTDNYAFLYEYLMCERRAGIVAQKLHMHRNNVKYRIDRIEGQYDLDTRDALLRFDLMLAYRMREARTMQLA